MKQLELAYRILFTGSLVALAVALLFVLLRVIRGPRIADRIMGVNLTGTLTIMAIAILSKLLSQSYLIDVGLIYALISFLSVVVLTKVYITVHMNNEKKKAGEDTSHGA